MTMTARSQYDPLDMALGVLSERCPAEGVHVGATISTRGQGGSQSKPSAAPGKVQANIRMNRKTIDDLRRAAIELMRTHSMGDIVDRLVADHLDTVARALTEENRPSRLPPGRRVRQPS